MTSRRVFNIIGKEVHEVVEKKLRNNAMNLLTDDSVICISCGIFSAASIFANKTSNPFRFIFSLSRAVLTLLSPPGVSPRSVESAASLSHVI